MLRNYIVLALRNLRNNRLYSFLNIAGLAVGLAAGVLVLLWVADEFGYNKFHRNLPQIYKVLQNQTQGGVTYTFEAMPGPLNLITSIFSPSRR
jgi:putative ABC transport system permease protein